jgi:hypothetical protein
VKRFAGFGAGNAEHSSKHVDREYKKIGLETNLMVRRGLEKYFSFAFYDEIV